MRSYGNAIGIFPNPKFTLKLPDATLTSSEPWKLALSKKSSKQPYPGTGYLPTMLARIGSGPGWDFSLASSPGKTGSQPGPVIKLKVDACRDNMEIKSGG